MLTEEKIMDILSPSEEEFDKYCEDIERARIEGIKEGIKMFAWRKDGVDYVGNCGITLKDVLANIDAGKI